MGWKGVKLDEVGWNRMKQSEITTMQKVLSYMEWSEPEQTGVKINLNDSYSPAF